MELERDYFCSLCDEWVSEGQADTVNHESDSDEWDEIGGFCFDCLPTVRAFIVVGRQDLLIAALERTYHRIEHPEHNCII